MVSVLPIGIYLFTLEQCMWMHGYAIISAFEYDFSMVDNAYDVVNYNNAFVNMYAKCGDVNIGQKLHKIMPNEMLRCEMESLLVIQILGIHMEH